MSDQWDEHYATEAGARYWPNEELVRFCAGKRFKRALDVGAGTGANVELLLRHCGYVSALEPNETAYEILAERAASLCNGPEGAGSLNVYDGDLSDYDRDHFFDLAVDCMTSQHIPWSEHETVYREYARVLEVGGHFWLLHLDGKTTHSPYRIGRGADFDYGDVPLFPSLNMFCLPPQCALVDSVRSAGFDIEEVRGLAREYPDGQCAHYTIIAARKA